MSQQILARRYLNAYLNCYSPNATLEAAEKLRVLLTGIIQVPTALQYLSSFSIPSSKKTDLLHKMLKKTNIPTDKIIHNFFQILSEKKRFALLHTIKELTEEKILELNNTKEILVTTRQPLNAINKNELLTTFQTFITGEIKIKETINPDSPPGFIAKFDQYVLDATTDHMLSLFKAKVKNIATNTNSIKKEG